jgi:iron complex transport system permease protein
MALVASTPLRPRSRILGWLALLLVLAVVAGVLQGTVYVTPLEVFRALAGIQENTVVTDLRLPRVLGAALVGAALGVAGAVFQGLFRNPLADPYLMGAASGAALGATVWIALGIGGAALFLPNTVGAFLGAIGAVGITLVLAGAGRSHDLVLAGVVVSSICAGLSTLIMLQTDRIREILGYTLGSVAFLGWPAVGLMLGALLLVLPLLMVLARALNALALGEDTAHTLGLPLQSIQIALILLSTLLTAVAVTCAGIIGFVGFVAPHMLRRWIGGEYRLLLIASALGGALLLVGADLLARALMRPTELPVGIITTLLGGPFFLYLLRRQRA